MIYHDVEQNTPEWYEARLGKFTASAFNDLFSAKTTATYEKAIYKAAFERITGEAPESFSSSYMERGHELEAMAISEYERTTFEDVKRVGFVELNEWVGCSPDGLVSDHGLIEVKCPAFHTAMKYIMSDKLPNIYEKQVHGQMYITGKLWCDFVSYHPSLPLFIKRIDRDEAIINEIKKELNIAIGKAQVIVEFFNHRKNDG